MNKDDIRRLSMKLLATGLADDGQVYLPREGYRKITASLPVALQEQANLFVEGVMAIIPNDFSFWFFFDSKGVNLDVEFADGNTSASAFHGYFTSRKSMSQKLRALNWDELRAELIERGGIMDEMVSKAQDRPVNIHSSKAAAQRYAAELVEVFDTFKNASKTVPFAMAFVGRDGGVIDVQDYPSRDAVVYDMAEVMTVGCQILAVFENNIAWSFEDIETAKLEAVEQLGPISRAKAEGRFFV